MLFRLSFLCFAPRQWRLQCARRRGVHNITCRTHTFSRRRLSSSVSMHASCKEHTHAFGSRMSVVLQGVLRETLTFIHVPSALSVVPIWSCRSTLSYFTVSFTTDANTSAIRVDALHSRKVPLRRVFFDLALLPTWTSSQKVFLCTPPGWWTAQQET